MTARCVDRSSPVCVLPKTGGVYTCPHCGRVWAKKDGAWWFKGVIDKRVSRE